MANEAIKFTVSYSADDEGYIVHQVSNALSFALVPANNQYEFGNDKVKAWEQVRRLHVWQAKGNVVELRNIETPERFEAVADTKYGCAW